MSLISHADYQHKNYSKNTARTAKTSLHTMGPLVHPKDMAMLKWSEDLQDEENTILACLD